MPKGYLCFVLHTHLPYVRHPEFEDFLEEDWLYEAITETYIPLINIFDKLLSDRVDFRLTMSLTPTLISMLKDGLLQERYLKHINKLIELSSLEIERTHFEPEFNRLAKMYYSQFVRCRDVFLGYNRDLIEAFKKFQNLGKIEIITCAATHGYFPLMDVTKPSIRAQLKTAVTQYEKVFQRPPRGIWIPECGYNPGDDALLKEAGLEFFFTDSHGLLHAVPRPKYGVFAPVYCKDSAVACFARDMESSKQVWSSVEGYPGDYNYREFYRDIGFDLDLDYIRPYICADGARINTGIKYYRITAEGNEKKPYVPEWAMEKASEHASNFVFNRQKQIEYLNDILDKKPIIVSPYDTELYGHWWFEGPMWLDFVIRKIYFDQDTIKMITPVEYLEENPRNQRVRPSMSSWGYKGYSEVWLQGANDRIYRHLHEASWRMTELANNYHSAQGLLRRALNQALRELLLAQSSDWAFIMAAGTHTSYAVKRINEHLGCFIRLYENIKADSLDEGWISGLEAKDNIFPDIDYSVHK